MISNSHDCDKEGLCKLELEEIASFTHVYIVYGNKSILGYEEGIWTKDFYAAQPGVVIQTKGKYQYSGKFGFSTYSIKPIPIPACRKFFPPQALKEKSNDHFKVSYFSSLDSCFISFCALPVQAKTPEFASITLGND